MKVMSVKHQLSLSKQKTPHDTSSFSGTIGVWETQLCWSYKIKEIGGFESF